MPNLQATEATKECVEKNQLTNYQCTPDARKNSSAGQILYIVRAHFTRIYFGVNFYTCTHVMTFVTCLYKF